MVKWCKIHAEMHMWKLKQKLSVEIAYLSIVVLLDLSSQCFNMDRASHRVKRFLSENLNTHILGISSQIIIVTVLKLTEYVLQLSLHKNIWVNWIIESFFSKIIIVTKYDQNSGPSQVLNGPVGELPMKIKIDDYWTWNHSYAHYCFFFTSSNLDFTI